MLRNTGTGSISLKKEEKDLKEVYFVTGEGITIKEKKRGGKRGATGKGNGTSREKLRYFVCSPLKKDKRRSKGNSMGNTITSSRGKKKGA